MELGRTLDCLCESDSVPEIILREKAKIDGRDECEKGRRRPHRAVSLYSFRVHVLNKTGSGSALASVIVLSPGIDAGQPFNYLLRWRRLVVPPPSFKGPLDASVCACRQQSHLP